MAAGLNKKIRKNVTNLIALKQRQQSSVQERILKLKISREDKLKQISAVEEKLDNKKKQQTLCKYYFYHNTISQIFTHKDVYIFKLDLDKLELQIKELFNQKEDMLKELWELDEKLALANNELRALIVKEEKFHYLNNEFLK